MTELLVKIALAIAIVFGLGIIGSIAFILAAMARSFWEDC